MLLDVHTTRPRIKEIGEFEQSLRQTLGIELSLCGRWDPEEDHGVS